VNFDRRRAVFAGAAGLLIVWWGTTARKPAPLVRSPIISRGVPDTIQDQADIPKSDGPGELEPPAPVLIQSAERRFSSPSSNGAAAGGIPGAEAEQAPATAAATRMAGGGVDLPGGSVAPTASVGYGISAGNPETNPGGGSGAGGGAASKGAGRDSGNDSKAGAPEDKHLTGAAANLVTAAQGLKARGDAAEMRSNASLEKGILRQIEVDNKVDAGIRGAIDQISRSGRPVTWEAVAKATEGVLKDNGLQAEDVDMESAIARASGPPAPPVPPGAYADAVKAIMSSPPLDPVIRAEIQKLADKPPPPRAPAPRGALDAFRQNHGVFDKALQDFGVKPEHILGILGVETTWGRNTGKYPLPGTLRAISEKTGPDGRPTKAALQAERDLAALARLSAQGNLGDLKPDQIRGSYAGAMGIPQFLPTSWEAYSRAPDGGKRDPFNFGDAAYSVGNYLRVHGYANSVPRSIWGYNHSQEYVDKVLGLSADVKASLNASGPPKQ
jgi:hypothetical protein